MFQKKTIRDIDVEDQIVLIRTDYNVPLGTFTDDSEKAFEEQYISSDFRIRASLPTIKYLIEHKASKLILISHLGRPAGKDAKFSLRLVAEKLAELLPGTTVNFVDNVSGAEVEASVEELPEGGILLLENLRFWPGEKENDTQFARDLVDSTHASLFVQDGFAVTHRAHASTDAIAKLLPAVAGLLVEKEVTMLQKAIETPDHPFTVIIGGAKVSDKQPLIQKFTSLADQVLVGGKIAADGYEAESPNIYVAEDFDENTDGARLDIGPVSTMKFVESIQNAKTVLWNGVLGFVEDPTYATASTIIAKALGENSHLTSIICGGDTAGFVENLISENPELQYSLISTGGGAALELLSGGELPGLASLENKSSES